MDAKLTHLHVFPVKSCAAVSPDSARVESRGLEFDRRWMIVDADGQFLTGRQLPQLTRLRALPDPDGLRLQAPGLGEHRVAIPAATASRALVQVWSNSVDAAMADAATNAWLSAWLGRNVRLAHMDTQAHRAVDEAYSEAGDEVGFADAFPLLLISASALAELNARLANPVPMLRFRPNLIVSGTTAHAEDAWRRIRIGEIEFDVVKPCTRCVFTTVDTELGAFDPSGEPLRTLISYRRTPKGVTFGQNLIPRGSGVLRVGDPLSVIA